MSIWYQIDLEATGSREAIAKFVNLPLEEIRTHNITLSFGGKNGPGLHLPKLVENNPDLAFLVKCAIECDTVQYWITKFDTASSTHQIIRVQNISPGTCKINTRILEEYTKECPSLPPKHFARQKGFEEFRWSMFFNDHAKMADMLNRTTQYKDMVSIRFEDEYGPFAGGFDEEPYDMVSITADA